MKDNELLTEKVMHPSFLYSAIKVTALVALTSTLFLNSTSLEGRMANNGGYK